MTKDLTAAVAEVQQQVATQPALLQDPIALAQLARRVLGVASNAAVMEVLRQVRTSAQGCGILDNLLRLPGVTDVVVNGPGNIFFERGHGLERSQLSFDSEQQLRALAVRLAASCGRRLDEAQPYVDARLLQADGTRVRLHAVLQPIADGGSCLSLRVLRQARARLGELVAQSPDSELLLELLQGIIAARCSFLVVGGTGSGKTTLLSAMLAEVAPQERIITIEDTAELLPPHPHVVRLVARPANAEGAGAVTMTTLLQQALRMRPDRVVVGEIRGAEVVDLLAALNTGHEGGGGTIHANQIADVPARLEALAALGGLSQSATYAQAAAAIEVVIALQRTARGREISEIGVLETNGSSLVIRRVWSKTAGTGPAWKRLERRLALGRCQP